MIKKATPVKSKAVKNKSETQKTKINWSTWDTTDNDEIERRKIRGEVGQFKLENLGAHPYFSTFCVFTNSDKQYKVEIRSLNEYINSCDCADYRGNELGTCKHIEYVIQQLQKKDKRLYARAMALGSEKIEIYLNVLNEFTVSVKWPKTLPNKTSKLIDPFFSADGTILGEDIVISYNKLLSMIQEYSPQIYQEIRVSEHIAYFIQYKKINSQKELARNMFLQDVDSGKRTLNTVKAKLLPYQIDGMLHLAFTERALLADEMGLGKTIQAIAACELLK